MFAHSECCEAGLIPRIVFYRCFVYAKKALSAVVFPLVRECIRTGVFAHSECCEAGLFPARSVSRDPASTVPTLGIYY